MLFEPGMSRDSIDYVFTLRIERIRVRPVATANLRYVFTYDDNGCVALK